MRSSVIGYTTNCHYTSKKASISKAGGRLHKIDNRKDLLSSTGNYIQYLAITYKGKESEIKRYIYRLELLCDIPETFGEGTGTPLQYSCLENPMDRGAWWAAVRGVAKSRTR